MTIEFLDEEVSETTAPTQPSTRRIVFAGEEDVGPAPAPERAFFSVEDVFSALGGVPEALAVGLPAAAVKGYQGLSMPERSQAIENEIAFSQRIQQEQADREAAGKATTIGSAIREALPSLGFTAVSLPIAIGAGAAGAVAGGPAAAVTGPAAAMAASGTASYRMAGADMLYRGMKQLEENKGAPLTDEEKAEAYKTFLPLAQDAALWEAGPEAVSNAISLGAGKFIFGFGKQAARKLVGEAIEGTNKTLARKIAEKTAAGVGATTAEVVSEGITAVGQYKPQAAVEQFVQTGTTEGAPTEYPGGLPQAIKDVAPATLALTGMVGLGAGGAKLATIPFRKPKSPLQIKEDNIDLEADREAENLMISPNDEEAKGLKESGDVMRQELAAKKELYTGLEPTTPEAQQLGLEIREMENAVQLLDEKLKGKIAPAESEQARLAREIAAPPAEPAVAPEGTGVLPAPRKLQRAVAFEAWAQENRPEAWAELQRIKDAERQGQRMAQPSFELENRIRKDYEEAVPLPTAAPVSETITEPAPVTTPAPAEVVTPAAPVPTVKEGLTVQPTPAAPAAEPAGIAVEEKVSNDTTKEWTGRADMEPGLTGDMMDDMSSWITESWKDQRGKPRFESAEEAWNAYTAYDRSRGVSVPGKRYFTESLYPQLTRTSTPAGIAVGSKINVKGDKFNKYVVEEVLPQTDFEARNNERSYILKNERTGDVMPRPFTEQDFDKVGGKKFRRMAVTPAKITPQTPEETTAFQKASSNKVMARNPEVAVAAVRLKNGEITAGEYADLIDSIDPFTVKGAESIPTKDKIDQYIGEDKRSKINAPIQSGKEVEFRIDIPTYNRSTAAGDTVYAVTAHEPVPETSTRVGTPISYLGVAKVINPKMMTRSISGKGEAIDIATGAGKFPLATVKGNYEAITELPTDINNPNVWTEVSYNPIRSSYFVDVRSKNAVVGGDEAIMVGSRVFVKNPQMQARPTGIVGGAGVRDIRYMAAEIRVEEDAQVVPVEDRYTFEETGIRAIEFFGGKAPDGLIILEDTTNPNYRMKAGYDPETGEIILNRAYIKKGESIEDILTHELGHYIFSDPKFQADFKNFLDSMPDDTRAQIEAIINESYNKETNETQIEERQVMAFTALVKANKDTLSAWENLKNTIKRWINRLLGTNIKLSDEGAMAVFNVGFKRFKSGEKIVRAMSEGKLKMAAEPRKPAAEEKPTGPAPESPEGQSLPKALGNGIDIGPENNMPVNRKIDSHAKNFAFLRGFFESASDRLRRTGFTKLANKIDTYFDETRRRMGMANKMLLPAFDAYDKAKNKKKIEADVEKFFAAQENGRDTDEVRKEMDPVAIRIVNAWQKFGEASGEENQRVGIKVYDPKIKAWRKIGKVAKFWPRRLKPEYQRALMDPDKYSKEYDEIVQALIESKKIKTAEEAEKFLRPYRPGETRNDYFSGIEQARGTPLSEKLYDYSMQVMTDYVSRWAPHVSRIEQFGQKTGENTQTLWEREIDSVTDPRTKDYLKATWDRVEGAFPNDPFTKGAAALNIWATGLQLGNPASAMLNFIGGSSLNAMIGQPGALKSYIESFAELRNLGQNIKDAQEKGILSRDLMNIVGDHQAILEESKVVKAGQKVADFLLKWSGFTPVEQMVRTQSFIIGKSFIRNTLKEFRTNPNGSFARRSSFWLSRNGFDLDKLIVENGTGPETDRLLRYFANISQGSYTIDQVPIFIDLPMGKFLFKYQKFSTQVMRATWKNTFEPLWKAMTSKGEKIQLPNETRQTIYKLLLAEAKELGDTRKIDLATIPTTVTKGQGRALALIPAAMWLATAYVGGEVLLRLRDILFGVLMKGPEYEDMFKELEDDEKASALYLAMERAWYNLIGVGALGLIGNYAQFFLDWQDRERVKNPLEPPALGVVKDTANFLTNLWDQGTITAGDIDDFLKRTVSAYRATKKLGESTAAWMGFTDIPGVKEEMFRREVANINKYARRWAEQAGIEYRMKRPSEVTATARTPINRKIAGYLQTGEPGVAAVHGKEYIKSLEEKDRENAKMSIITGARNRQPLRLGNRPMDEVEKKAFLEWLKENVSEERFQKIKELDAKYQKDYRTFLSEFKKK